MQRLVAAWAVTSTLALFVVLAAPRMTHVDFVAFYCGGQTIVLRADPYREMPLHRCEQAVTREGPFATGVTVPAPLPPFALAPFAVLSLFDFRLAFWMFTLASVFATVVACLICARLSGAPLLLVLALAAPTVWDNWLKGQPVPFAFLALAGAGALLRSGKDRWAGIIAMGTLIQPQIGLAACASLLLWRPRTRVSVIAGLGILTGASVALVGMPTAVEYVRVVLPLHAQSEAWWFSQLSAVSLLVLLGVPAVVALRAAAFQQALTSGLGVLTARFVARKYDAVELLAFFPALAAAIGGTYEHDNALLIVLPAAIGLAQRAGGTWRAVGFVALMPWLSIGDTVSGVFISLAIFSVVFVLSAKWKQALLAALACAVLAIIVQHIEGLGATVLHGTIPVDPSNVAEHSWAMFVTAMNPPISVLRGALALKLPTWLALIALLVVAANGASATRPDARRWP